MDIKNRMEGAVCFATDMIIISVLVCHTLERIRFRVFRFSDANKNTLKGTSYALRFG